MYISLWNPLNVYYMTNVKSGENAYINALYFIKHRVLSICIIIQRIILYFIQEILIEHTWHDRSEFCPSTLQLCCFWVLNPVKPFLSCSKLLAQVQTALWIPPSFLMNSSLAFQGTLLSGFPPTYQPVSIWDPPPLPDLHTAKFMPEPSSLLPLHYPFWGYQQNSSIKYQLWAHDSQIYICWH